MPQGNGKPNGGLIIGVLHLAAWREKKGITIDQIAGTTKISSRALRAIEAGEYEKLPGGVYTTSYLKQYAQFVQLDEADLLAHYYETTGLTPAKPVAKASSSDDDQGPGSRVYRHYPAIAGS
jgi:cytoskeletal protein RodZ